MDFHPLYISFTAGDVLALVITLGVLACWIVVLPDARVEALDSSVRHLLGAAIALLTLSSMGILVSRVLEMGGGNWSQLLATIPVALRMTHYGHVWLCRLPALILLWRAWMRIGRHHRRGWPAWIMLGAAAVIAFTRADSGHAADEGDFTIAVWIDLLHLLSGSAWVGALFGMTIAVFPKLSRPDLASPARAAEIFERLSALSGYALGVILLTGFFTAWRELGGLSQLWSSGYGRVLALKLALVAAMIGLGIGNRYVRLPRLLRAAGRPVPHTLPALFFGICARPEGRLPPDGEAVVRSCARAVLAESLLGVGVLVAASFLLHSMPAAEMQKMSQSVSYLPALHQTRSGCRDGAGEIIG